MKDKNPLRRSVLAERISDGQVLAHALGQSLGVVLREHCTLG